MYLDLNNLANPIIDLSCIQFSLTGCPLLNNLFDFDCNNFSICRVKFKNLSYHLVHINPLRPINHI